MCYTSYDIYIPVYPYLYVSKSMVVGFPRGGCPNAITLFQLFNQSPSDFLDLIPTSPLLPCYPHKLNPCPQSPPLTLAAGCCLSPKCLITGPALFSPQARWCLATQAMLPVCLNPNESYNQIPGGYWTKWRQTNHPPRNRKRKKIPATSKIFYL